MTTADQAETMRETALRVRPVPFAIRMQKKSPAGLARVALSLPSPVGPHISSPTSPGATQRPLILWDL